MTALAVASCSAPQDQIPAGRKVWAGPDAADSPVGPAEPPAEAPGDVAACAPSPPAHEECAVAPPATGAVCPEVGFDEHGSALGLGATLGAGDRPWRVPPAPALEPPRAAATDRVDRDACARACAHILVLTVAELPAQGDAAVRPALEAALGARCVASCLDAADVASLRCVMAAGSLLALSTCPH